MIEQLHIETVEGLDPDEPVVMLNLMKFRARSLDGDGTGWDAYLRYSRQAASQISSRGGSIMWAGEVNGVSLGPEAAGQWDYAALVFYPTPGAFLDMMQSEPYAKANIDRSNGCEEHLIMATTETLNSLRS